MNLEEENKMTESLKGKKKKGQRIDSANIWSISYVHWGYKHEF